MAPSVSDSTRLFTAEVISVMAGTASIRMMTTAWCSSRPRSSWRILSTVST